MGLLFMNIFLNGAAYIKRINTVWLIVILSLMPMQSYSHSPVTKSYLKTLAYVSLIAGGVITTVFTGLNIPNVADQQKSLENCKFSANASDTELAERCTLNQFYTIDNTGFQAMFATLAPSVDSLLWLSDALFLTGAGLVVAVDTASSGGVIGGTLLLARVGAGIYGGYFYGLGDESGANEVGARLERIRAYNEHCLQNISLCSMVGPLAYAEKNVTDVQALDDNGLWVNKNGTFAWRDKTKEQSTGLTFQVLNRLGGATVGFTLFYSVAGAVLQPVEHAIYYGFGTDPVYLRSLSSMVDPATGTITYTLKNKALTVLNGAKSLLIVVMWYSPWNPFEKEAAPVWNGKEVNAVALFYINGNPEEEFVKLNENGDVLKDKIESDLEVLENRNIAIVINDKGVIYHKADPLGESYTLENITESIDFILQNSDLQFWNATNFNELQTRQDDVGLKKYTRQFRMLTVSTIANILALPENGYAFYQAFLANRIYFALDVLWNSINIGVIFPYNNNLKKYIGGRPANATQSIVALQARLENNRSLSGEELIQNQEHMINMNIFIIDAAWIGNLRPRFTELTKIFVSPYTDGSQQLDSKPGYDVEMQEKPYSDPSQESGVLLKSDEF